MSQPGRKGQQLPPRSGATRKRPPQAWCPYCGTEITAQAVACPSHCDLPRLDPYRQQQLPAQADTGAAGA